MNQGDLAHYSFLSNFIFESLKLVIVAPSIEID